MINYIYFCFLIFKLPEREKGSFNFLELIGSILVKPEI